MVVGRRGCFVGGRREAVGGGGDDGCMMLDDDDAKFCSVADEGTKAMWGGMT